jgi:hypothetical protein
VATSILTCSPNCAASSTALDSPIRFTLSS